jgi:PTH1 family peptidyl-tRNA hydrolase
VSGIAGFSERAPKNKLADMQCFNFSNFKNMRIIIGLGNPGEKYIGTRHNIGFDILDELKNKENFPVFEFNKKFNADISTNKEIILIKPQAFMNLSGEVVRDFLDFYKLSPDDILVIHDDKDISLGEYRLATDSSSAGHNGVQNIIENLGTQKFKRIRIGIGIKSNTTADLSAEVPLSGTKAEVFVLQKFSDEEKAEIVKIQSVILDEIKKIMI